MKIGVIRVERNSLVLNFSIGPAQYCSKFYYLLSATHFTRFINSVNSLSCLVRPAAQHCRNVKICLCVLKLLRAREDDDNILK